MWIIRLALKRPYTFVVAALLLLLVTPFVLLRTPTDVLPEINIPVVSIIWNFTGLSAKDIEQRIRRSCSSVWRRRRGHFRTTSSRHRAQSVACRINHRPRDRDSVPLRRQ